tara:strand:+ start:46033 stop:46275 length:243 start_codon:yes stop_codon:yes gene_type:complete
MNTTPSSKIRIGRFDNNINFTSKKYTTNLFDLLNQVSSDDLEFQKSPKQNKSYLDIPPIHLIDWKNGILNGMSWADAVGA